MYMNAYILVQGKIIGLLLTVKQIGIKDLSMSVNILST